MKKLDYKLMYALWAAMYALTVVLGFCFSAVSDGPGRTALTLTAAVFFVPPWLVLLRAKEEGNRHHIRLIRWLCIASLVLTCVLLVLNLISLPWGEAVGDALYAALVVASAPMTCSSHYALPLFLWGTLLAGTFGKK